MKKSVISYLVLFILIFSFGCKKDDSTTTTPGLSVKIDGTTWTGQVNTWTYVAQQNITLISASNSTLTEQLQVAFSGHTTGTYNFTANDLVSYGQFAYMTNLDMYSTISSTTPVGQIVVTEYDTINQTISGTFHFEAYNFDDQKKVFTDGVFTKLTFGGEE
jgi:hypothetical protein